jgi:hypothetical protein
VKKLTLTLLLVLTVSAGLLNAGRVHAQTDLDPDDPGTRAVQDLGVTEETFDRLDPLQIGGSTDITQEQPSAVASDLSTPGGIVSRFMTYLFPLAGLLVFVMGIWGGFETLAKSASSKSIETGQNRVKAAVIGFILLFSTYWLVQIVQIVFNVSIL